MIDGEATSGADRRTMYAGPAFDALENGERRSMPGESDGRH